MSSSINLGDVLVSVVSIGFFIIIAFIVIWLFRSNNKRKNQLDRIEQKIDDANKQLKNNKE